MSNFQSVPSTDTFTISSARASDEVATPIHTDQLHDFSDISSHDDSLSTTLQPFRRTLIQAFDQIKPPSFCTGGRLPFTTPSDLSIVNIGQIKFPLNPTQAAQLIAESSQSPFGRGSETLIDCNVRNCRQINPSRISVSSEWNQSIQRLALTVGNTLGISTPIRASLYKLVLYEHGGFFKPHKDTEKEPGMCASLIVQLPAKHSEGSGALVVRHHSEEHRFDFSRNSGCESFFSSFYADCDMNFSKCDVDIDWY